MLENRVKRVMREGGVALIGYVGTFTGPIVVELAGLAGYDGIRIDLEHSAFDLSDIHIKVLAAEKAGITPIVRVPSADPSFILRLLDMGVQGVTVPHITTAEQARAVVQAVRYPPAGARGIASSSRAALYGRVPTVRHIEESNREIMVGVLIEDAEALDEIDEIAAIPGIDLVAIGSNDLSKSLGVPGTVNHPTLVAAIEKISNAVKKGGQAHLSISIEHRSFPRSLAELRALGVRYAHVGPQTEVRLLDSMTKQLDELRKQLVS